MSYNWDVGVSHELNDKTSLDLQYQDTATDSGLVALMLNYALGESHR